jgi:glycerophosphoryl diester phosphodiesterase
MNTFGKSILLFTLSLGIFISCSKEETEEKKSFTDIFVAHAGGGIEGIGYTNSLEALNLSYSKGCKIVEIDLLETSDGKLIAANDWRMFKNIAGFPEPYENTPLTEEEVLSSKIHGRFTPINLNDLTGWLAVHNDVTLMTDKLNKPAQLRDFPFKNRLIMELFTWEAVEEAIKEGITPMPSDNLIFQLDNDSILVPDIERKLAGLNIRHISISRRLIENNKEFLKRLKGKGIKTYVYHIGWDEGKDERYVFENEMDYISGMFADNLDLIRKLK